MSIEKTLELECHLVLENSEQEAKSKFDFSIKFQYDPNIEMSLRQFNFDVEAIKSVFEIINSDSNNDIFKSINIKDAFIFKFNKKRRFAFFAKKPDFWIDFNPAFFESLSAIRASLGSEKFNQIIISDHNISNFN